MPITPYFTFAFVLLATLLASTITHAQQGNLPKPVQKLPAYPPVACVTPDWRSEPCEGRHDIPQVMEEDRAQPALPLLNSRNTPRAFECIKPAEPGWLGLGGLFQLLDCTWFGWIEPYPVKPFDGKWPASQLAEPVKCLKPDGTEEPCESRHTRPSLPCRQIDNCAPVETELDGLFETLPTRGIKVLPTVPPVVTVLFDYGGILPTHDARWREVAAHGGPVKVLGPCGSGCTMVMAYIPKDRLCFGEHASLSFHQSRFVYSNTFTYVVDSEGTKWMISRYPQDIRRWIRAKGGVEKMTVENWWTLPASQLWKMGYSKCSD
jgi:hypothetical protein